MGVVYSTHLGCVFPQDLAHPGSLSKEDSEQECLILDLAQQAEKITPNMTLQVGIFPLLFYLFIYF